MNGNIPEILVGVDGSDAAGNAVDYAAGLAELKGAPVRLIHCVPALSPLPPLSLLMSDMVITTGRGILDEMAARARAAAPDVEVRTRLAIGPRGAELVDAAAGAQMIVLGRRSRHSPGHLATGTMAAAVAAHVGCAVRVVPADWKVRAEPGEVVVGIKDVAASIELIRRGFAIARDLGAGVVLLRAWQLGPGYEHLLPGDGDTDWHDRATAHLDEAVGPVRDEFADVRSEVRIVHREPALALVEASENAEVLVVGRHSHRPRLGYLGSTARTVLGSALCPVEIGPATLPAEPGFDLVLEEDGALLR